MYLHDKSTIYDVMNGNGRRTKSSYCRACGNLISVHPENKTFINHLSVYHKELRNGLKSIYQ